MLHLASGGGGGGMVSRVPKSHQRAPRHGKPVRKRSGSRGKDAGEAASAAAAPSPNLALRGGGGGGGAGGGSKGPPKKKTADKKPAFNDDELEFLGRGTPREPRERKAGGAGKAGPGTNVGTARPWERVPDKKEVKEALPIEVETVAINKGLSKMKGMARAVNRSDDRTFAAGTFGDARFVFHLFFSIKFNISPSFLPFQHFLRSFPPSLPSIPSSLLSFLDPSTFGSPFLSPSSPHHRIASPSHHHVTLRGLDIDPQTHRECPLPPYFSCILS